MGQKHEVQQQGWMCKRDQCWRSYRCQDSSTKWQTLWMQDFEGSTSSLDRGNRTHIRKVGMLSQVTMRLMSHGETVAVISVP